MARSQDEIRQDAFSRTFTPASDTMGNSIDIQMAIRSAWALEYIAAQLGMMRELMERERGVAIPNSDATGATLERT
jgi:hypothetical protein